MSKKNFIAVIMAMVLSFSLSVVSFSAEVVTNNATAVKGKDALWVQIGNAYNELKPGTSLSYTLTTGQELEVYSTVWEWEPNDLSDYTNVIGKTSIYQNNKLLGTVKDSRDLYITYKAPGECTVTVKFNKNRNRIDIDVVKSNSTEKVNTKSTNQQLPAADPNVSPQQAKQLADYYKAIVKKNNLEGTGAVEEQLVAFYTALANKK